MGKQFDHPFIPPLDHLNQGLNENLHISSQVGKAFGLGTYTGGYSTSGIAAPYFSAVTTSVADDRTPIYERYFDPQGASALWTNIYASHFQITENDWNTYSDYFLNQLFGGYLQTFVDEFLYNLQDIINYCSPALIETAINQGSDFAPDTVRTLNQVIGFMPNIEDAIYKYWDTINNIATTFGYEQANTQGATGEDWQKLFLGVYNSTTEKPLWISDYASQASATTTDALALIPQSTLVALDPNGNPPGTNLTPAQVDVLTLWEFYLYGAEVENKQNSIMYYAYLVMLTMLNVLQGTLENQADRVTVLTNAQEAATNDMAAINFTVVTKTSDVTGQTAQQTENGWIAIYRAQRNVLQSYSQMQSSAVNNTNSSQEQETSLISQILETMDNLIQSIFLS